MNKEIRILMLEDMATDADLVTYELKKGGVAFQSMRVDSKDDFLKGLSEFRPDVILADYHLPQFTGMEAFQLKVKEGSDASFIIVSGALSEEVAVECMKEGVDDYLLKSNLRRLTSAVHGALEKRDLRRGEAQALASLMESEARYKRITKAITDYVYTVHVEKGKAVRTVHGPGSVAVTGYSPEEFERDPYLWFSIVTEEDREAVNDFAREALRGKAVRPVEHRIRKKDGTVRWVKNTVVFNHGPGGELISYDGLIQDITERKEAEEKLFKEREVLSNLVLISEATASIINMERLLSEVAKCTCKILGSDVCLIYLWDKEAGLFRPEQQYGLSKGLIPHFKTDSLDIRTECIGKAFVNKLSMLSVCRVLEPGRVWEKVWLKDTATAAMIPLLGKGGPLGIIFTVYKTQHSFSEWDKTIAMGISSQTSVAIEQARLYKETLNKTMELSNKVLTIEVMNEIGRSILSTLEPHEILETVVRMTSRLIPCDGTAVLLVDNERNGFVYKVGNGMPFVSEDVFIPYEETLASEILTTGMPQFIPSLKELGSLPKLEEGLLSEGYISHIRVPIIAKNEIIGLLVVDSISRVFSPGDLTTLERLAYQIGMALQNARQVSDLEDLFIGTVKSLSSAIDAKSKWTAGHSGEVAILAVEVGRELGLSFEEAKKLELASLLHDIGKIGTYEKILEKPERMSSEEEEVIRLHPGKGAEILTPIRQLREIIPIIRHHQEHFNGMGYPDHLQGDRIPLLARILAVADSVEAMTSDRPYREGRSIEDVISELTRCSGTQFDPQVVDAAVKVLKRRKVRMNS